MLKNSTLPDVNNTKQSSNDTTFKDVKVMLFSFADDTIFQKEKGKEFEYLKQSVRIIILSKLNKHIQIFFSKSICCLKIPRPCPLGFLIQYLHWLGCVVG